MNSISSVHQGIQSLSLEIDFSDTRIFISLPFPTPLRVPQELIIIPYNEDNVQGFQYKGRSFFQDILNEITDPRFLNGPLWPLRTGNSHLLAALAHCFPDYLLPIQNLTKFFRGALLFTFHNESPSCNDIISARDMGDLLRFLGK
jgi:hypothetical protein